jgi:hypothetical protein
VNLGMTMTTALIFILLALLVVYFISREKKIELSVR